jgi:uncharacterized membrane protein
MPCTPTAIAICRRVALGFVFVWFFAGGIMHFAFTGTEAAIIPPWLPHHRLLVLISGVFELLGAAGSLLPRLRSAAGWGLVLLTAAVTPANIYMWQQAAQYPHIPYWALTLRLPFQAVLVLCIWWATRPTTPPTAPPAKTPARPDAQSAQ